MSDKSGYFSIRNIFCNMPTFPSRDIYVKIDKQFAVMSYANFGG
jgi:hypothetical protein